MKGAGTALITGGAGAIGASIASELVGGGFSVVIVDLDEGKGQEVADQLNADAGSKVAIAVGTDIADDAQNAAAVAAANEAFGPISVLVNNAGWDRIINFTETTPEFWDQVININLRGAISLTHLAIPQMKEAGYGRIINVASDAGRVGSSGEAVYSACKGGMIAFAKSLARELARSGITSNSVCPGPTDTPLLHNQLGEGEAGQKIHAGLMRAIPMKRLGQPDDIAGLVGYLASEKASFVTGQTVSVSGGLTMQG